MRIILRAVAGTGAMSDLPGSSAPVPTGMYDGGMVNINPFRSRVPPAVQTAAPLPQLATTPNVLPREDLIEKLLHEYFSNTGLLFPYIHEASFMETYRQVKSSGFSGVRRTWLALLNVMLAMATRADPSRGDTHRAFADSDVFYQRSQELCKTQMLRGTTLETGPYIPKREARRGSPAVKYRVHNYGVHLLTARSSIPPTVEPVLTGHSASGSDLDNTWTCSESGLVHRLALAGSV